MGQQRWPLSLIVPPLSRQRRADRLLLKGPRRLVKNGCFF
ncbi:hypothetical protein B4113_1139 [Geobacillus sp. B4113_201601]|nr:hypothetical protein B4113_1139 [Geobacillus sp. B4113_201601]